MGQAEGFDKLEDVRANWWRRVERRLRRLVCQWFWHIWVEPAGTPLAFSFHNRPDRCLNDAMNWELTELPTPPTPNAPARTTSAINIFMRPMPAWTTLWWSSPGARHLPSQGESGLGAAAILGHLIRIHRHNWTSPPHAWGKLRTPVRPRAGFRETASAWLDLSLSRLTYF